MLKLTLEPIIKWAGGKESELKYIIPNLPTNFANFYEPFVGGGSVYMAMHAGHYFINDKSQELISLYRSIANCSENDFINILGITIQQWDFLTSVIDNNKKNLIESYKTLCSDIDHTTTENSILVFFNTYSEQLYNHLPECFKLSQKLFNDILKNNIDRKIKRMMVVEAQRNKLPDDDIISNIETAFKSGIYMYYRELYNKSHSLHFTEEEISILFLVIRNFAYSGMFRYNSNNEFNVPYGGIGYNRKNLQNKLNYYKSQSLHNRLKSTTIDNLDFEDFLDLRKPTTDDFIFLDPPYDTEFSTYSLNEFTKNDQIRLAHYMINICKAHWMLIIKHTDFIFNLYNNYGLDILPFDKTYKVSFMNRNDKNALHLLIKNY